MLISSVKNSFSIHGTKRNFDIPNQKSCRVISCNFHPCCLVHGVRNSKDVTPTCDKFIDSYKSIEGKRDDESTLFGKNSTDDVTFIVEAESIRAHRIDVF